MVKSVLNSRKTAASNIDFRRSAGTVNNRGTWRVIVFVELPVPGRLPGRETSVMSRPSEGLVTRAHNNITVINVSLVSPAGGLPISATKRRYETVNGIENLLLLDTGAATTLSG